MLKAQDGIIGKAYLIGFPAQAGLHYILEPSVQDMVQEYIGQKRTDRLPLSRSCFADEQFAVIDDSDVDLFLDQAEHAAVIDPLLDHLNEN